MTTAPDKRWKFAIDVGGTFTDCIGISPDGQHSRLKVLSSGGTKGVIEQWPTANSFIDSQRIEVDRFWIGARFMLLSATGQSIWTSQITGFNGGDHRFELADPLPSDLERPRLAYELVTDLAAPVLAIHRMLQVSLSGELPPGIVHLGTTWGTNALLTRRGARTALVTTRGFRDVLRIGDQARPELFALTVRRQPPLCETSIEIDERILADGTVEVPVDPRQVRQVLSELREAGIESIAICLMHGYKFPDHERLVADLACESGWQEVCRSSVTAPLIKLLARAETTVLDAFLNPVLRTSLNQVQSQLGPQAHVRYMTSAGRLVSRARFSGKDSLLSGPAGGVVGAAHVARCYGYERAIGFDMGGTSTDVSRYDGQFELDYESTKAGVRIMTPVMSIETVAAGGGSICRFDGTRLVVGPGSAGASPGPACYGRGGPLTVTDVNLLLGRIDPNQFPFPLQSGAARERLGELQQELERAGFERSWQEVATGLLDIANHQMAEAIRNVSVARGFDPREYPLVSFGGAAAQHCCAVANLLNMKTILIDPQASILSALGLHLAEQGCHQVSSILQPWNAETEDRVKTEFGRLRQQAASELKSESGNLDSRQIVFRDSLDVRYVGTEPTESIEYTTETDLESAWQARHQLRYGYVQQRGIEIVAARVEATLPGLPGSERRSSPAPAAPIEPQPFAVHPMQIGQDEVEVPEFRLGDLKPGQQFAGPAIVSAELTTTVLLPGWTCQVEPAERLLLTCHGTVEPAIGGSDASVMPDDAQPDPVRLEIFNRHFESIATQMGTVLQRTASSVNVKERLDFSCALFTRHGDLVVNAPHIPVHLGAMSETIRATRDLNPDVRPGDAFVTNDPYAGGSHLPDVTVVTPVFGAADELLFWVASRAHHAEIGGIAPGSMPATARTLGEEGVLIQNFKLVTGGQSRLDELREQLCSGPVPSRTPEENIRDIRAQLAANRCGELALADLVERYSIRQVSQYMKHIQAAAESRVRGHLATLNRSGYRFEDQMDSGQKIVLSISTDHEGIQFDFGGTDPVAANNLNANRAIVSAAIMYSLRVMVGSDMPLNQGMMKPVRLVLPECFLNTQPAARPADSPPIVGGNVETSQRIVDVIFGALGLAAASHGTMNNWLAGDEQFGYYETVGGGSGATAAGPGAAAVHCHMSNTRLTDAEILESRYPLVLREFSIRRHSGGAGTHSGGDGMRRHIEFRKPLTLSLLTSRRNSRPWGMHDGEAGQSGENILVLANGTIRRLPSTCQVQVQPGDLLRLHTPGGGGWGPQTI